jgi:hypothetical protein
MLGIGPPTSNVADERWAVRIWVVWGSPHIRLRISGVAGERTCARGPVPRQAMTGLPAGECARVIAAHLRRASHVAVKLAGTRYPVLLPRAKVRGGSGRRLVRLVPKIPDARRDRRSFFADYRQTQGPAAPLQTTAANRHLPEGPDPTGQGLPLAFVPTVGQSSPLGIARSRAKKKPTEIEHQSRLTYTSTRHEPSHRRPPPL